MAAPRDVLSEPSDILLDERLPGPFYGLPSIGVDLRRIPASSVQAGKAGDLCEHRQRFELELLSMKAVWNANLPVHTLPAELLLEVFKYSLVPHDEHTSSAAPKRPWTRFMGVCRHWCALIRNDTAFWSTINITKDLSWMELALRRSHKAPIYVILPHRCNANAAVPRLLQHAWRVKYLEVPTVDAPNSSAVQSLMDCSYPLLLHLTTNTPLPRYGEVALPPLKFGGDGCPRLEVLHLSYCSLSWTKSLFSNLQDLCLTKCKPLPQLLSLAHFLDVLEHGQQLQVLKLGNFLSASLSAGTSVPPGRLVTLPKLSHIQCLDAPVQVARLVSHLRTLAPVWRYDLTGTCGGPDDASTSYSSLLPQDATHVPFMRTISSATIAVYDAENCVYWDLPFEGSQCWLELECADALWDDWLASGLSQLPALFASSDTALSSLTISGKIAPVSSATWDMLFESFSRLECVVVEIEEPEERLESTFPTALVRSLSSAPAVSAASESDDDRTAPGVRCPALADLDIGLEISEWNSRALEDIIACLSARAASGAPKLKFLRLHPILDATTGRGLDNWQGFLQRLLECVENIGMSRW